MSDDENEEELQQQQTERGTTKKSIVLTKNTATKFVQAEKSEPRMDLNSSQTSTHTQNQSNNTQYHGIGTLMGGQPRNPHTAFTGSTALMHLTRIPDKLMIDGNPSKREKNEINLIKRMIISYFDVVKKNINDLVPKAVITFFIKKTIDMAEKEMVHNLYDEKLIDNIMREDQEILPS